MASNLAAGGKLKEGEMSQMGGGKGRKWWGNHDAVEGNRGGGSVGSSWCGGKGVVWGGERSGRTRSGGGE